MSPRSLANKLMRKHVRLGKDEDGKFVIGTVVGTQYLCTDCRIRLPDGSERWIATHKLDFVDTHVAQSVRVWWSERSARL